MTVPAFIKAPISIKLVCKWYHLSWLNARSFPLFLDIYNYSFQSPPPNVSNLLAESVITHKEISEQWTFDLKNIILKVSWCFSILLTIFVPGLTGTKFKNLNKSYASRYLNLLSLMCLDQPTIFWKSFTGFKHCKIKETWVATDLNKEYWKRSPELDTVGSFFTQTIKAREGGAGVWVGPWHDMPPVWNYSTCSKTSLAVAHSKIARVWPPTNDPRFCPLLSLFHLMMPLPCAHHHPETSRSRGCSSAGCFRLPPHVRARGEREACSISRCLRSCPSQPRAGLINWRHLAGLILGTD